MNKKLIMEIFQQTALVVFTLAVLIPIFWIVAGAFKSQVDLFQLKLFFEPTLDNFREIFKSPYNIHEKFFNSAAVSLLTVLFTVPIAGLAAYSFSRYRIFAGKQIFLIILTTQFIPAVVIALPFFVMYRDLGLLDSKIGLIIINFSLTMPFAVWMLKSFIDPIPMEAEESAMIDGAGRLRMIWDIVLPMAFPGVITTSIFCFILSWNEFIFALILTIKESVTLTVGLSLFKAEEGVLWNLISAAGILIMVPMFILTLIIQKHIIKGMSLGALK